MKLPIIYWYPSHMRAAKAPISLQKQRVLTEPTRLAYTEYEICMTTLVCHRLVNMETPSVKNISSSSLRSTPKCEHQS